LIKGLAIAIAIVLFALLVGCIAVVHDDPNSPRSMEKISSHHSYCEDDYSCNDNGSDYGNRGDQSRCRGNNCRGSFSPGPFDRSPVDIHDNQVCISPDCSSHNDGSQKEQRAMSIACLVPYPYHCDPK